MPKNFWDDGETTPDDIRRRTANLKRVLGELIKHALSTGPLDASRVARWHKDLLSGLSYVTDPTWLGAYRGSDHPDLENMGVRVGTACGVSPYQVNEALVDFFGNLQQRLSTLGPRSRSTRTRARPSSGRSQKSRGGLTVSGCASIPLPTPTDGPPGSLRTGF